MHSKCTIKLFQTSLIILWVWLSLRIYADGIQWRNWVLLSGDSSVVCGLPKIMLFFTSSSMHRWILFLLLTSLTVSSAQYQWCYKSSRPKWPRGQNFGLGLDVFASFNITAQYSQIVLNRPMNFSVTSVITASQSTSPYRPTTPYRLHPRSSQINRAMLLHGVVIMRICSYITLRYIYTRIYSSAYPCIYWKTNAVMKDHLLSRALRETSCYR